MKNNHSLSLTFLIFLLFSQLTTPVTPVAYGENVSKIIDWSKKKNWTTSSVARDFAVSFDKKKIFILEQDNKVRIYANSYNGNRLGIINVAPTTVAFDIAPRGGMLYLVGSDRSYTAMKITYRKENDTVTNKSIVQTWKTRTRPLDIAQSFDKKYAFILESDNKVHVYTINGIQKKVLPVPFGTIAITVPSRKRTLSLITRNRIYKSIRIPLR
ncbi:MAG: hypothetical protein D3920_00795 [Candidatus Electrothrix sp. AW2]|jgi:hypothetical protein|nr:hypothetical protein [Candidatus Electrothrix sp. AX1]MCI5127742.1 hypothetical protein [Candidatus Electrothrix gigas]MCI5133614.1 hypothetical protein [Candidatus Electrothrix gigas]MCI5178687.1 hypothetical protein [Candidatus Electrothrix gigas]MCI5181482.1 hypothetical protein [Candidatus Electrothrix gigas]